MTKEYADILVYEIASLRGYVFNDEHYFEYLGTWNSPDDDGELSYIYYYHEPIACDKDGNPYPTGYPCYWICNKYHTGRIYKWPQPHELHESSADDVVENS
jgi:hypothetical protein